jgi:hypothetical protein
MPPAHAALARLRDTLGSRVLPPHLLPGQFTPTALQTLVGGSWACRSSSARSGPA